MTAEIETVRSSHSDSRNSGDSKKLTRRQPEQPEQRREHAYKTHAVRHDAQTSREDQSFNDVASRGHIGNRRCLFASDRFSVAQSFAIKLGASIIKNLEKILHIPPSARTAELDK